MGVKMGSFAFKAMLLAVAVLVAAEIPEDEVSSGTRAARSITNLARLLLGGNVPPDHPLVKYPDTAQTGSENKLIAAVPGMAGKKPEYSSKPSFPVAIPSTSTTSQTLAQTPSWQQTNQGYIAPPVQQPQLITSQQAYPAGVNFASNHYNAPPNTYNAPVNSYPAPGNAYNAPYNGGGGSPGTLIATNGNGQQSLYQQQQQQQPYTSSTNQLPIYASNPYQSQAPLYNPSAAQQPQYAPALSQPVQSYPPSAPVYQPNQGSYPQTAASSTAPATATAPQQNFFQNPYNGQTNFNGAQGQSYYGGPSPYLNNNNNNNPVPVQSYSSVVPNNQYPAPNSPAPVIAAVPTAAPAAPFPYNNNGQAPAYPNANFNAPQQNNPSYPPQQQQQYNPNYNPGAVQPAYNPVPQASYPVPSQNTYNNQIAAGAAPYNSQGSYPPPGGNYNPSQANSYPNPVQNSYNNNPSAYNSNPSAYNSYPPQTNNNNNNYNYPSPSQNLGAPAPNNAYPNNNVPPYNPNPNNKNYQVPQNPNGNYYSQQQQSSQAGSGKYPNYGNQNGFTNNNSNGNNNNNNNNNYNSQSLKYNSGNNQYRGGHTSSKESSSNYGKNIISAVAGKLSSKFKQSHGGHEASKSNFQSPAKATSYLKSSTSNKYGRQFESKNTQRPRYQNKPSYPRHDFSPKSLDESSEEKLASPSGQQFQEQQQGPTPIPTRPYRSTDEYQENYHGLTIPSEQINSANDDDFDEGPIDTEKLLPDATNHKSQDFVPSLTVFSASYVV